jgi:hypothetical protein
MIPGHGSEVRGEGTGRLIKIGFGKEHVVAQVDFVSILKRGMGVPPKAGRYNRIENAGSVRHLVTRVHINAQSMEE